MNFSGWVQLRRGILEHTMTGALSTMEAMVLVCLITLADKSTGTGWINAPALRTYLPELSYDAAKRVLLSLQEKRYIFRAIIPYSNRVYRYWVNNYEPSTGRYQSLRVSLEQVFETRDPKDIQYVKPVPDGALGDALRDTLGPAPTSALGDAPNNKKDKEKENGQIKRQNDPLVLGESVSTNTSTRFHETGQNSAIAQPMSPARRVPPTSEAGAEGVHVGVTTSVTVAPASPAPLVAPAAQDITTAPELPLQEKADQIAFGVTFHIQQQSDLLRRPWTQAVEKLLKRGVDRKTIFSVNDYYREKYGRQVVEKEGAEGFEVAFDRLSNEMTEARQSQRTNRAEEAA